MKYEILQSKHYKEIWNLFLVVEGNKQGLTREEFYTGIVNRIGWVILDDNKVAGCVSLSNHCPNSDIVLHATIYPEYHGKWMSKKLIKEIANKIFNEMRLPRVTSYSIPSVTDHVGKLLENLGFKCEGRKRNVIRHGGEYKDHILYGMLKEECRWI